MGKIRRIPQDIRKIGFDIDETVAHMLEPHVGALEQITSVFENVTRIPSKEIRESIARVFEKRGTADYHRLIQEMDCFDKMYEGLRPEMREQMRDELIEIGKKVFKKMRAKFDPAIDGIPNVLKTLNENGIECFAFSNAPIYRALDRIKRAHLGDYFKLILGLRDDIAEVFPNLVKIQIALGEYNGKYEWKVVETAKPNANLSEILGITAEEVQNHVAFVGDSYTNDMGLAAQNKCVGFHALYGRLDPFIKYRLRLFSTEGLEARFKERGKAKKDIVKETSVYELHRPEDLLRYLGIK